MSSFHVDSRINLKLDYELAIRIGELILRAGTEDKQILALGHKLANIDEENQEPVTRRQETRQHGQFSSWAKSEEVPSNERYSVAVEKPMQEASVPAVQDKIRSRKIRWGIE